MFDDEQHYTDDPPSMSNTEPRARIQTFQFRLGELNIAIQDTLLHLDDLYGRRAQTEDAITYWQSMIDRAA